MRLIAHNIRSLHNVGAIFRSADAFALERLYLTGYTPTPPRKEIAKVALGGEDRVSWEPREDVLSLIADLKKEGFKVVALENAPGSSDISAFASQADLAKTALILGSEVEGVPADALAACDAAVEIPLPGKKRSLNVSVATGVALFVLRPKNG